MAAATTSPSWSPSWLPEAFRFSTWVSQRLVGCNHGAVPAYWDRSVNPTSPDNAKALGEHVHGGSATFPLRFQ